MGVKNSQKTVGVENKKTMTMSGSALSGSARGCCGMAILLLFLVGSSVMAQEDVHLNSLEELENLGNEEHEEHGAEPADAVLFPR